jgi:hypothetical protein
VDIGERLEGSPAEKRAFPRHPEDGSGVVDHELMSRFSDQPHLPGSRTRLEPRDDRLASLGSRFRGIVGWGPVPLSLPLRRCHRHQ